MICDTHKEIIVQRKGDGRFMEVKAKEDRRVTRTKGAINRAFLELLAEKEFERITINDIADRADVNRATIYLHYADKYDLLDKCIEEHLDHMVASCLLNKSLREKISDPSEASGALEAVFVYLESHYLFFSSMLSGQRTAAFRECMMEMTKNLIRKQINLNGMNLDMDAEVTLQFAASAFVGVVEWWIANQMPHQPAYMADQAIRLFERHDICG